MLFKRSVSLTDSVELRRSSVAGSGYGIQLITANGANIPGGVPTVPQARIWTQYAGMFEYYQVKSIHVRFFPYKYEYTAGIVAGFSTQGTPVFSIIDPENTAPTAGALPSGYLSYGNCQITKPYDIHHRSMNNYTDLGLSK